MEDAFDREPGELFNKFHQQEPKLTKLSGNEINFISGTKSAKKSSRTTLSNQSTPCAPSSSRRSSTSNAIQNRKIHHLIPLHPKVTLMWKWYQALSLARKARLRSLGSSNALRSRI